MASVVSGASICIVDHLFPLTISRWRTDEICHYLATTSNVDVALHRWYAEFAGDMVPEHWMQAASDYGARLFAGRTLLCAPVRHDWCATYGASMTASCGIKCVQASLDDTRGFDMLFTADATAERPAYSLVYSPTLWSARAALRAAQAAGNGCGVGFQVYPGAGFVVGGSDDTLRALCEHAATRFVIATQPRTVRYLLSLSCPKEKIVYLFGVVMSPPPPPADAAPPTNRAGALVTAFASADRTARKGYDVASACISRAPPNVVRRFHIVGAHSYDTAVAAADDRVVAHGMVTNRNVMRRVYADVDVLLAPMRAPPGDPQYDGYPAGCVVEAAFDGVVPMTRDAGGAADGALLSGPLLIDGVDAIVLRDSDGADQMLERLTAHASLPLLQRDAMSACVQQRFTRLYDDAMQLEPRRALLTCYSHRFEPSRLDDVVRITLSHPMLVTRDFGGGCSLDKAQALARLIYVNRLTRVVELGVYRGRSLMAMACASRALRDDGFVKESRIVGVDPYTSTAARQPGVERAQSDIADQLRAWYIDTPFDDMHAQLSALVHAETYADSVSLLRLTSDEAVDQIRAQYGDIDLLHIDGNHDTKQVRADIQNYVPMVRTGGFVVLDAIHMPTVRAAIADLERQHGCIVYRHYNDEAWAIWRKT